MLFSVPSQTPLPLYSAKVVRFFTRSPRSVYSAQHLAEHLNRKYGIEVRLCHREQGISKTFRHTPDFLRHTPLTAT